MKNILFSLILAILLPLGMMAQSVTLTFTGKDANNNRVQLDRVSITNLTKGWQETVYWPDTTLTMQNGGTGIDDYANNGGFVLSQNNPNPFNGTTDVLLTMADAGAVTMEIMDANGRMVVETTHALSLPAGTHQFRVSLSAAGTYVMTARQNGKMASIKMVNNGGGNANGIEYAGEIVKTTHALSQQPKSDTRGTTNNPFNFGDQMEYVGYATINGTETESERITQQQGASQTFALVFAVVQHTVPSVTTAVVSNITGTSATVGGNVTSDGEETVFDRGICYSTVSTPTVSDNCIHIGQGTGSFSDVLTGLLPETTYYVRAFAINSIGVGYGSEVSFTTTTSTTPQDGRPCPGNATLTDIDGNVYNTVQIGQQCWMKENLRTTKYADNTLISPLYAPNNSMSNVESYGYLYNWTAVMHGASSSNVNPSGVQGICPNGWHVPSVSEWVQLTDYVSSQSEYVCGYNNTNIAKSLASTTGWNNSDSVCAVGNILTNNNLTGFSALPAGNHYNVGNLIGNDGFCVHTGFWCATEESSSSVWRYWLHSNHAFGILELTGSSAGYSVRCVRDEESSTEPHDGQPCPNNATVTDIDGNVYNTVQIGAQCWMKENLRTTRYADNTEIPAGDVASYIEPYHYAPNNDESNVPTYGYLYNWAAVMHGASSSNANPSGVQGICPNGWHVPSDAEWTQLTDYVSSQDEYVCGSDNTNIAKALAATTGWIIDNGNCVVGNDQSSNNITGFNALSAGHFYGVDCINFTEDARFWCTTDYDNDTAFYRLIAYNYTDVKRYGLTKNRGYSIRCIKD